MATRTVRLDDSSEQALAEIREMTGLSTSEALKQGLFTVRQRLREREAPSAWDVYQALDLGPGGDAKAPSTSAKAGLRAILRRKHRR